MTAKRLPKELTDMMRIAIAAAWEEGYRQAQTERSGMPGMGEYGGPIHCNPWDEK